MFMDSWNNTVFVCPLSLSCRIKKRHCCSEQKQTKSHHLIHANNNNTIHEGLSTISQQHHDTALEFTILDFLLLSSSSSSLSYTY